MGHVIRWGPGANSTRTAKGKGWLDGRRLGHTLCMLWVENRGEQVRGPWFLCGQFFLTKFGTVHRSQLMQWRFRNASTSLSASSSVWRTKTISGPEKFSAVGSRWGLFYAQSIEQGTSCTTLDNGPLMFQVNLIQLVNAGQTMVALETNGRTRIQDLMPWHALPLFGTFDKPGSNRGRGKKRRPPYSWVYSHSTLFNYVCSNVSCQQASTLLVHSTNAYLIRRLIEVVAKSIQVAKFCFSSCNCRVHSPPVYCKMSYGMPNLVF